MKFTAKQIIKTTAILFMFSAFLFSQETEMIAETNTSDAAQFADTAVKQAKVKKPKYSLKMLDYNIVGLKGIPLSSSETSDEDYSLMKGRNIIGVNFKPLIKSTIPIAMFNTLLKNKELFGFKLTKDIAEYADIIKIVSKSYGGLTVHYTFLLTARIGLEAGVGYAGVNFNISANKEDLSKLTGGGYQPTVI